MEGLRLFMELTGAVSPQTNNVVDIVVPKLNVMDHGVKVKAMHF
jgi:hypothetical protein